MERLKILKELEKYPVFNLKLLNRVINKRMDYAKLVMHRLSKEKLIHKIERDNYTLYTDPLVVASNMIWPCYISCWTALRYYNLTEQLPDKIFIITPKARKNKRIMFMNNEIIFIKVKQKYFFGYKRENYKNFGIFIAEAEKAIIDSAMLKKVSFSEIVDILKKNKNAVNFNAIIKYLLMIKSKTLIKRFGFLLDYLEIKGLSKLMKFIDNKYVPLDYAKKKIGIKNKLWMVIENVKLD